MRETTKKAKELRKRIMYPLKTKREIIRLDEEVGAFFESNPPEEYAAIVADVTEVLGNFMLAIEDGYLDHIGDDEKWWETHRDELIDDEDDDDDDDEFDFGDDDSEEDDEDFDDIDDFDDDDEE